MTPDEEGPRCPICARVATLKLADGHKCPEGHLLNAAGFPTPSELRAYLGIKGD